MCVESSAAFYFALEEFETLGLTSLGGSQIALIFSSRRGTLRSSGGTRSSLCSTLRSPQGTLSSPRRTLSDLLTRKFNQSII